MWPASMAQSKSLSLDKYYLEALQEEGMTGHRA